MKNGPGKGTLGKSISLLQVLKFVLSLLLAITEVKKNLKF